MISARPPHKQGAVESSPEDRRTLVEVATREDPRFIADDRELRRDGPSYTVTTLEALTAEHPGRPLFSLVGGDNIRSMGKWYQAERIFRLSRVVAMPRPGEARTWTEADVPFLGPEERAQLNADVLDAPEVRASSTEIRAAAAAGKWDFVRARTGPAVADAIQRLGLYRAANPPG